MLRAASPRKDKTRTKRPGIKDYRELLMNAPIGIFTATPEGRFSSVNPTMARLYGYDTPRQMIRSVTDIAAQLYADPSDRGEFQRIMETRGQVVNRECRMRHRDGSELWVSVNSRAIRGKDGNIDCYQGFLTDITEQKRIEETLLLTQFATDRAPDSILWVDDQGNIVYANNAARASMGFTREELLKTNVFDMDPDFSRDDWERHKKDVQRLGRMTFEGRHRTKDGRLFPVEVTTNYLEYKGRYFAVAFDGDITERKRAEENLQILAKLLDACPACVVVYDMKGKALYANEKTFSLHGCSREEFLALRVKDLYPPGSAREISQRIREIVERGEGSYEITHLRKDGTLLPLLLNSRVARWGDQPVILSVATDLSERKRAEEALRVSEETLRNVFKASPVGLGIFKDHVVQIANKAWCDTCGYAESDLVGNTAHKLFDSDEEYERVGRELYGNLSECGLARVETRIRRKDGVLRDAILTAASLHSGNASSETVIVTEDITDRKRAEEAIQKRIVALTQPIESGEIAFEDLFDLDEIQRIQDEFAIAMGVAAIIARPDGTPITAQSNFSHLCGEYIRKNERERLKCEALNAAVGRCHPEGPLLMTCPSAGLWHAGASITVGGRHIASWLIGQVREEDQTDETVRACARNHGADEASFAKAFREIPIMTKGKFERIANALFTYANQLSTTAYQNVQQARFITDRKRAEDALRASEEKYRFLAERMTDIVWMQDVNLRTVYVSPSIEAVLGFTPEERMAQDIQDQITPASILVVMDTMARELALEQQGQADPNRSARLELEYYHKDGSTRWIESIVSGVRDKQGILTGFHGVSRDITRRKQAEEALRESEIRYKSIFENTGSAMLIIEEDMTISLVNGEFEDMTGYRQQDLNGRKWTEFVEKSDLERMIRQHHLRRGADAHLAEKRYEFRMVHRDGRLIDTYLIADIIPGTKKTVAACIDITRRKRAEEAVRESEKKYRFIAEKMTDVVWIRDLNMRTVYISPSVEAMLGFTPEERMSQDLKEQLTPASMSMVLDIMARELALEQGGQADPNRVLTLELEYYHKDGSTRWIESIVNGIRDDRGMLTGIHGVSRDATRRIKAEEAVRESAIRYQSIFENTGTGMLIIEEDMTISYCNNEFEKMTGCSREEIEGKKKWTEFVEKSDRERMIQQHRARRMDEALAKRTYEFRMVHRDGRLKDIYLSVDLIPGSKKSVCSLIDITDRKRMEEALKESEEKYRELSIIDGLTQLYNSRHFSDQLRMEIERVNRYGVPMSLILFDIDHFKAFNDTYGHVEGDRVLTRLGAVIKRCLRSTDSAYRYGGEEFTIILPMTKSEDGAVIAERIRTEFKKEDLSPVPGKEVHMTVSMGLAQYIPREEMKTFVHRVDQLMYGAKKSGRDRLCSGAQSHPQPELLSTARA